MRIRSVSIEGFGPFKSKQFVDFRAFDADGLFLIAGETGVGKTSVLDAIAYALYNKTPRWDNVSATGASNSVRSDFCGVDDPTEVIVEFETGGAEYRVTRSPEYEQPKSRGGGTTRRSSKILIEVLEDAQWVGKATKEREAAELVEGLLKLNKDEFLQVIMLAQGRFQEFLLATSAQRLDLLSKLFGTGRFADYQSKIVERRSALSKKVETANARRALLLSSIAAPEELGAASVGDELTWLDAVIAAAEVEVQNAKHAIEYAKKAEAAALEQLDVAKRQARRAAAIQNLTHLSEQQESIDVDKARLARAERAERVRDALEDAVAKREAEELAETEVASARSNYSGDVVDAALGLEISRLTEEVGKLTDALEDEKLAKDLELTLLAKDAEKVELEAKLTQSVASIKQRLDERMALAPLAAQTTSARDNLSRAEERLSAATQAAAIAEQLRKAQEAQLAADTKFTAARVVADGVLARFLHGQAAVLATRLVAGEPCMVCGSTEHPAPAPFSDDAVVQSDVDDAQEVVARLEPQAKAAKDRVDELKVESAMLAGITGESDVASLAVAAAAANEALTTALTSERRIAEIDKELDGEHGLFAAREKFDAASKVTATELTKLTTERDALVKKIAKLRGEFATVRARYDSLVAERDAVKHLADAIASLGVATTQRANAESKLAAKLAHEKFDSAKHAEDALLDDDETVAIKGRLEKQATALSENQGVLKQADLQDLPSEVIEVEAASTAHRDAQRLTQEATSDKANAESAKLSVEAKRNDVRELLKDTEQLVADFEVLNSLAETVSGRTPNTKSMSLESYYIAAELEDVLTAASVRLRTLSRGRFELRHTERGVRRANTAAGLEIEVFDEFTGTARPANQLSGGQQFLASLALALGLAEVVTSRAGGIELNTLFVDEGFGSLSTEYLEIAMETLDSLKQGGRTVGVISHVASMQEQIAAQLRVVAEPGGPSQILQATESFDMTAV